MTPPATVLAPSAASLPDNFRIPSSTSSLTKSLGRLSRQSLINVALQWLDVKYLHNCQPYLSSQANEWEDDVVDDDTNPYTPADSVEELRIIYENFGDRKGGKREIVDRILEGDWRHGLTLRQLAMADVRGIEEHPVSYRWTALKLESSTAPQANATDHQNDGDLTNATTTHIPQFHISSFLKAIQREISPLVKAHYYVYRLESLPLTLVRIFVIDSPYQYPRQSPYAFTDASRLIYLAFPDSTPFVYSSLISLPGSSKTSAINNATDTRTLRRIVRDALPKALSRPRQRYVLKPTSLTTKSLYTLLTLRGPWRTNCANGAFTIFADAVTEAGPLESRLSSSLPLRKCPKRKGFKENKNNSNDTDEEESPKEYHTSHQLKPHKRPHINACYTDAKQMIKKQKGVISRFGTTGDPNRLLSSSVGSTDAVPDLSQKKSKVEKSSPAITPNPALDRLQIHLQDPLPSESAARSNDGTDAYSNPTVSLTFSGSDVISGLRHLVELGVIDAARMPSWMTGEEGVSSATIRGRRRVAR